MSIEEIIQRDIDEICTFGHYSVAEAYKTLLSAKETIQSQEKEIKDLIEKGHNEFCANHSLKQENENLEKENTQLKQKLKESEERNKELVLGIRNMMSDKCWDVDKQAKQLLEKNKQPIKTITTKNNELKR